jgi:integrase
MNNTSSSTSIRSHPAADALDWDEAMSLIKRLKADARYRDSMLIACGCFLGLRISDILRLKWNDVLQGKPITLIEKKTGKKRTMKVNPKLSSLARYCYKMLAVDNKDDYIFCAQMYGPTTPMTRQRAAQILVDCKEKYDIRSAKVFSTHSLRKTFGRRIWMNECKKEHGDYALMLLQEIFGHSSAEITKRYLGIRQEEILSAYDQLTL